MCNRCNMEAIGIKEGQEISLGEFGSVKTICRLKSISEADVKEINSIYQEIEAFCDQNGIKDEGQRRLDDTSMAFELDSAPELTLEYFRFWKSLKFPWQKKQRILLARFFARTKNMEVAMVGLISGTVMEKGTKGFDKFLHKKPEKEVLH